MYHEVWRIERSYFYDPNLHGVNAADAEKAYEKYLAGLSSRADLNYLFRDMLSDITSGHLRGNGGTIPTAKTVPGGLLGADYEIANGRYRFKKIYVPESWNPQIVSPLTQPGLNVKEGDYLLAVNGQDLDGTDDVQRLLENTAGKHTILKIAADAGGAGAREITVVPIANEQPLRHSEWLDSQPPQGGSAQRRQTGLRLHAGYGAGRLHQFQPLLLRAERQAGRGHRRALQLRRPGGRLRDRSAQPQAAGLVEPALRRHVPHAGGLHPGAEGDDHQRNGRQSGGDAMPWMFRYTKTGPLIGKRTWGGLIGISQYPDLDGRRQRDRAQLRLLQPRRKMGRGEPRCGARFEVDQDPKSVAEGHDPQLERAVKEALALLEKNPPPTTQAAGIPQLPASVQTAHGDGCRRPKVVDCHKPAAGGVSSS